MRLHPAEPAMEMRAILNPRGALAKELEATCKRAMWLSVVCEHWLSYKRDDYLEAKYDEPTYNFPKSFEDGARFNQARKLCGAWDTTGDRVAAYKWKVAKDGSGKWVRGGRGLDVVDTVPVAVPSFAARWHWPDVFDSWFSGALAEAIERLKKNLPDANVELIEKEVLK